MRLLLDTHYIVWAAAEPRKLDVIERVLLGSSDSQLFCSAVNLWELRLKWTKFDSRGQRKGPVDPVDVRRFIERAGWTLLPLAPDHAIAELETPLDHTDPFDELLLVQAQIEGLRLLTRDTKLLAHPLAYRQA